MLAKETPPAGSSGDGRSTKLRFEDMPRREDDASLSRDGAILQSDGMGASWGASPRCGFVDKKLTSTVPSTRQRRSRAHVVFR